MARVTTQSRPSYDPFLLLLAAHELPLPQTEYRFDPVRKWRFDYCWPDRMLAVEQEGGIWSRGRHARGAGMLADMEKYNQAQVQGWIVLRFSPEQLASGEALPILKPLFGVEA